MKRVPGMLPSGILIALGALWFFHGDNPSPLEQERRAMRKGRVSKLPEQIADSDSRTTSSTSWVPPPGQSIAPEEAGAGRIVATPEVRRNFEEYRLALALRDHAAEEQFYPLLIAQRSLAVECAREALRAAETPEDRALAQKCLSFLEVPPPEKPFHHGRSGS